MLPFVAFPLRVESYPALLKHRELEVCLLAKGWEGESLVLSHKTRVYGTWYFAEISGETDAFLCENSVASARYFWHKSLQHKGEWRDEGWTIGFAGPNSLAMQIYPPVFESNSVLRWFFAARQL